MKKRLLAAALLCLPLVSWALPHTLIWDPYPRTDATIYAKCWTDSLAPAVVGSASASDNTVGITFDGGDQAGDILVCVGWAQVGSLQSPLTAEVSTANPLPAPVGLRWK